MADGVFQVSELHETGGEPFIQLSDQCGPQIILSESGLSCAFVIHTHIKIFHISSNSDPILLPQQFSVVTWDNVFV